MKKPSRLATSGQPMVFFVTSLGAFMGSLDLSIVNVAFPALERSFSGDSRALLAWIITGYSIVFGAFLVAAGRAADRLGRKRVFSIGMIVFVVGSVACAASPDLAGLIAGRLVQGVGAAAMLPSSLGLLLDAYPAERRSQVVATWGGVGALAVATGPTLGALLISAGGWRLVFLVNVPIAALALAMGKGSLPDLRPDPSLEQPDYLGVVLVTVSAASLVLAISEGPTWGWSSFPVILGFVVSAGLGNWFVRRSTHHANPILNMELFRSRSFSVSNLATLVYAMGFFAMLLGNILFLTTVWHYSILQAGLSVTPSPIVVSIVSRQAGKLASRFGFRPVVLAGGLIFAAGLLYFPLMTSVHSNYLADWLPGTLVVGLGIGLTFPVLGAAAVSSLAKEFYAVGGAVGQTARQIGGAIGVAILVVILGVNSTLSDFRHLWFFCATMALVTALLAIALANETGPRGDNIAVQSGDI